MKTVLITGCSSGFGRATAAHFLAEGWNVVATMRTLRPIPELASDQAKLIALDVTDRASVTSAVRDGIAAFGGLDVLVNNAGIGLFGAFEATPEARIREIFETNTFGVMSVCQSIAPYFRERRAGTLINVTSSVVLSPMPFVSPYTASKYAIDGFTESLAYELSAFGVRTKIVQPGYSPETGFSASSADRMSLIPPPYAPYAKQFLALNGSGKTTTESAVAQTVWLAATDGSKRLRYAAGADAEDLAALRRAQPGEDYLETLRAVLGPKA